MPQTYNWDPCIVHKSQLAADFIAEYFESKSRNTLLISGAGFDPRAVALCRRIGEVTNQIHALFIQEQRPNPDKKLVERATENVKELVNLLEKCDLLPFDIFGSDNAVVGGRNIVKELHKRNFDNFTDVVVDMSAMSIGTSFPLIRYLTERMENYPGPANLHLFVMPDAKLDESIVPIAGDKVGFIHGFRGGWALEKNANAAKLWLPQLARGRRAALQRIFEYIQPHDTCPILPFPSNRPRLSDELSEYYLNEIESVWTVDPRNVIYAAEGDPLDIYRTVLRIDDLRNPVFKEFGGSLLVLSPTGSKILALGALMAALERNLPVAYLESIGYKYNVSGRASENSQNVEFIHVWLEGDVYPSPRRNILKGGVSK